MNYGYIVYTEDGNMYDYYVYTNLREALKIADTLPGMYIVEMILV